MFVYLYKLDMRTMATSITLTFITEVCSLVTYVQQNYLQMWINGLHIAGLLLLG